MRYALVLALFCGCLWAASAAADPVTKRNNDATLRAPHLRVPVAPRPRLVPRHETKPEN